MLAFCRNGGDILADDIALLELDYIPKCLAIVYANSKISDIVRPIPCTPIDYYCVISCHKSMITCCIRIFVYLYCLAKTLTKIMTGSEIQASFNGRIFTVVI